MKKILIVLIFIFAACSPRITPIKSRSLETVNIGTTANDHTGDPLRTAFQKVNLLMLEANRIGIQNILATAEEINILHNLDPNLIYIGDIAIITAQVDAALTDNTPSDAEITAALGGTAAVLGKNYTRIIKDTSGSGLVYLCISDGTSWHYIKSTIAV